ncbi:MAG TPA: DegT/DnrJ/EryC1/StrS family aminotransferase [Acidimicrobiales bacterium]
MSSYDRIPLVDLGAQHEEVALEVAAGFDKVLSSTAFVGGPDVDEFEAEFAAYTERQACVGVANGTDAIELVVRALEIGPGDEVVVPANTFIATAEAVARAGATVVLADCDPTNLLIDPASVADRLTDRTRAVIAVDLYGQIAPMEELRDVIAGRHVHLLEDAAQSQGARRHDRTIGSLATAAMTSFYPGKNLGAYGDAGAVVTDDDELATRVRTISSHGGLRRYEHVVQGFNSRLDTLQAVVLRAKLSRLEGWNERRREAAARYDALLADVADVRLPGTDAPNLHVWHLYVVRVPNRDAVLAHLNEAGVGAGIHYPKPLHQTEAFAGVAEVGSCPVAETEAGSLLTLPLFPHITEAQQVRVVETLVEALS